MTEAARAAADCLELTAVKGELGHNWVVRDNLFEGLFCSGQAAASAVQFTNSVFNIVIERNRFVDVDRAIFLGSSTAPLARPVGANACQPAGVVHVRDAVIRNNTIANNNLEEVRFAFRATLVCGVQIVHNTAFSNNGFPSGAISLDGAALDVSNNFVSGNIVETDTVTRVGAGNLESAFSSHFVDAAAGDLHLSDVAKHPAVNAGIDLAVPASRERDLDDEPTDGPPDIGADER